MGSTNSTIAEYKPATGKEAEIQGYGFQYGFVEARGRRREMEDIVQVKIGFYDKRSVPDIGWFAIFDGHGGERVASYCADNMFKRFMNTEHTKTDVLNTTTISKSLTEAYLQVDEEVATLAPMLVTKTISRCFLPFKRDVYVTTDFVGSTATTVVMIKDEIVIANVGDSRALYVSDGQIRYQTPDHHPDEDAEMERITNAEGLVVSNRVEGALAVSRAIGDYIFKSDYSRDISEQWVIATPEIQCFRREEKDEFILIASDGLWSVMQNTEVIEFVRGRLDTSGLETICEDLLKECLYEKGSKDNITIILIKL